MSSVQDNKLMQNEERIDRYLRGEMATREREAFEQDLLRDRTLRRQAVAMAIMVKSMANVGNMEDEKLFSNIFDTYDTVFEEAYASTCEEVNVQEETEEENEEEKVPTSGLRASAIKEHHHTENEESAKSEEKRPTQYASVVTESRDQIRCSSITESVEYNTHKQLQQSDKTLSDSQSKTADVPSTPEQPPAPQAKTYEDVIANMSEEDLRKAIEALKYITEQLKKKSKHKKDSEDGDES